MSSTGSPVARSDRWTTKRAVVTLGVLGGALAALAASQTWGTGTASAQVVGVRTVSATGGQLAPLVPALGLVGGAAAIAAATTGRVARLLAAVAVLLAGLGVVAVVVSVVSGLARALGEHAATVASSSTVVPMTATATVWPWVGALGGAVLLLDGVLALLGTRRWPAPSRRYERAGAAEPREKSLWERVGDEDADDLPAPRHADER